MRRRMTIFAILRGSTSYWSGFRRSCSTRSGSTCSTCSMRSKTRTRSIGRSLSDQLAVKKSNGPKSNQNDDYALCAVARSLDDAFPPPLRLVRHRGPPQSQGIPITAYTRRGCRAQQLVSARVREEAATILPLPRCCGHHRDVRVDADAVHGVRGRLKGLHELAGLQIVHQDLPIRPSGHEVGVQRRDVKSDGLVGPLHSRPGHGVQGDRKVSHVPAVDGGVLPRPAVHEVAAL
mmetsp:Transcript_8933/g.27039  ORF Transcript_8933/g.27039 Transcript_8933/m.27039 type:complete len:234 (+) Transcript_8933:169-870(+)